MNLIEELKQIQEEAYDALIKAETLEDLESIRVQFFGKKGEITKVMKGMGNLPNEEKPKVGAYSNEVRENITERLENKKEKLEQQKLQEQLKEETLDVTLPGRQVKRGAPHILNQVKEEIEDLFLSMGYQVVYGPEVEEDFYNFERMNLPPDHPARDMQDSFYITEDLLLRTHTSPVQARVMDEHDLSKAPLKMISPGKVYRRDNDDATHSHQFSQVEGLVVDRGITLGDLKGTLEVFAQAMFGSEREVRLRPSYFPFTEPSTEIDVSCFNCGGSGCSVCKQTGWIEILGGGMVHPEVLEMSGIDSDQYSGFAFGLGIERVAMLRYGINDIRDFYMNDQRFLEQFKVRR